MTWSDGDFDCLITSLADRAHQHGRKGVLMVLRNPCILVVAAILTLSMSGLAIAQPQPTPKEAHVLDELGKGMLSIGGRLSLGSVWLSAGSIEKRSEMTPFIDLGAEATYSMHQGWSATSSLTLGQIYPRAQFANVRCSAMAEDFGTCDRTVKLFTWWSRSTVGMQKQIDWSRWQATLGMRSGVLIRHHSSISECYQIGEESKLCPSKPNAALPGWHIRPLIALHVHLGRIGPSLWTTHWGFEVQVSGLSGPDSVMSSITATVIRI